MPISPTTEQIENSLRWWIAVGSGLASRYVTPANSGKPAHNDPYATLLLVSQSQPGKPVQRRELDGAGDIDEGYAGRHTRAVQCPVVQGRRG